MVDPPVLVYLVAVWVVALVVPGLRNLRFLGSLAAASVVIVAAQALPPGLRTAVRVVTVVAIGLGILAAERVGLGSLNLSESKLDHELQRAERLAASPDRGAQTEAIRIGQVSQ